MRPISDEQMWYLADIVVKERLGSVKLQVWGADMDVSLWSDGQTKKAIECDGHFYRPNNSEWYRQSQTVSPSVAVLKPLFVPCGLCPLVRKIKRMASDGVTVLNRGHVCTHVLTVTEICKEWNIDTTRINNPAQMLDLLALLFVGSTGSL